MKDRDELIKALGDAFEKSKPKEVAPDAADDDVYRFEKVTIDDVESSRLVNLTEPERGMTGVSEEMIPILDLFAFLRKNGSSDARKVTMLLKQRYNEAAGDEGRMNLLSETTSEVLARFRSAGENELQQTLILAHCENCLKQIWGRA